MYVIYTIYQYGCFFYIYSILNTLGFHTKGFKVISYLFSPVNQHRVVNMNWVLTILIKNPCYDLPIMAISKQLQQLSLQQTANVPLNIFTVQTFSSIQTNTTISQTLVQFDLTFIILHSLYVLSHLDLQCSTISEDLFLSHLSHWIQSVQGCSIFRVLCMKRKRHGSVLASLFQI